MSRPLAFVRSVPDSFSHALRSEAGSVIDVETARHQHRGYMQRLAAGGFEVEELGTPAHLADAVFIEDPALIIEETVVLSRPGAPSRRPEVEGVGKVLEGAFAVRSIEAPGTLDGGDVLRMGGTLFVGLSERTNEDGIRQLAALAIESGLETVPVPVADTLHLKSVVTALDEATLIAAPGHFDPDVFGPRVRIEWITGERHVNVLRLPDGTILVPESQPLVRAAVESAGWAVVSVDVSEFEKADGGLTCLSLRTDGS
jgi:dimethylargininase